MYEEYSKQSLPSRKYRELLGSAICVFNSNNAFIIENILKKDEENRFNWQELIDYTSGQLSQPIKETITKFSDTKITSCFSEVIGMRNRIIHSFRITDGDGKQTLATKHKNGKQFIITEDYLYDFIKKNEELSDLLHEFRGY
ncbi:selenium binding protein [Bacillus vallismortis]|uniref:selenium binding protein n=1 Tax=Bacillus vallismortis TaxID=72361 RepID=UPI0022809F04|nr:selenium binding protein [Bacillus vallismortis]MCY7919295.1 selenium binding protein [Bacillus vallismortis]MCY8310901.1 selenium binding protein [Bacillus vallismortis]MCY8598112.1 selenium binding protein [Bacillus vallismortis]MEC1649462.1 selenium binding protein [Bacillus vallismortis]